MKNDETVYEKTVKGWAYHSAAFPLQSNGRLKAGT